jgi:transcriptional regulator GlxA family with amidase domain
VQVVAVVLHQDVRLFDLGVAVEALGPPPNSGPRPAGPRPQTELRVCSVGRRSRLLFPGTRVQATHGLDGLAGADLVVVPGTNSPLVERPESVLAALRLAHDAGSQVASLCSGAFALAEAGLLDGRRATTHWALAAELARRCPRVDVDPDALFVHDDGIWTSAGTAAGIDLCLELVRHAHGAGAAAAVARRMVAAPHRAGGQAQFIAQPLAPLPVDDVGGALMWARSHLDTHIAVADLARVAHLSQRTFLRRFVAVTGTTPLRWLTHARVLLAQQLLEGGTLSVEQVARRSGLGSAEVLRTQFRRELGTTPSAYAAAFARPGADPDARARPLTRQDGPVLTTIRGEHP